MNCIKIIGARQHNLKNINLQIPKNQFVVIKLTNMRKVKDLNWV